MRKKLDSSATVAYRHSRMKQKPETINGRLLQFFGVWKVQSSYGTFPLSASLQSKPEASNNADWVSATVKLGEVTEYHFANEPIDNP